MKTVYLYDRATGEYKGEYQAQESPLEKGAYITPTDSTAITPPTPGANQVAVFSSGKWSLKSDYRGQTIYDKTTGASQEVTAIGPVPSGYSLAMPLAAAKMMQSQTIIAAAVIAQAAPLSFTTGAGTTAIFPMQPSSQMKYLGAYTRYVVHGATPPPSFAFYDQNGAPVPFTAADIDAFATAGFGQVEAALDKQATLLGQIEAATTVAKVRAVAW